MLFRTTSQIPNVVSKLYSISVNNLKILLTHVTSHLTGFSAEKMGEKKSKNYKVNAIVI